MILLFQPLLGFGESKDSIKVETEFYTVFYSENYEQPMRVSYKVLCPHGNASRSGMSFKKYKGIHTSDNTDYADNVYDKGHIAPAAAFNCNRKMLSSTFSYLNAALQHQGLNRGPWKELERFERNLAKMWKSVNVNVTIHFENSSSRVDGGALIPSGFTKKIEIKGVATWQFYFPNKDVSGSDWGNFQVPLSE